MASSSDQLIYYMRTGRWVGTAGGAAAIGAGKAGGRPAAGGAAPDSGPQRAPPPGALRGQGATLPDLRARVIHP
eukprot:1194678-Prorocentrum_minimum.AAC.2